MSSRVSVFVRMAFAAVLVSALIAVAASPAMMTARADDSTQVHTDALPVISWMTANVSAQRIYQTLYDLQNYSTRYVYTTNCNDSAQYIYRDFSNSSNLIVESQYFVWQGLLLRNVVATLPAFNPANHTVYLIGGHYDSITFGAGANPMVWAPGADDDGSGTVATMEVARVLSDYKFNATLKFSAWTAEEVGLVGSDYEASKARNDGMQIGAVIGMDMIGNYATTMGLDLVHDGLSEWIADALINANTDYGIGLTLSKSYSLSQNSDHASFWAYGYNAIMAAEADFSPNWHLNTDTIDNVNLTLITRATKLAAAGIAELAGIIQPGYAAIALDKQMYKPGDLTGITLYDSDINFNPGVAETTMVTAYSNTEPGGQPVQLIETGTDTGIFSGSIELTLGPPVVGKLEVKDGDRIHVDYVDAVPPETKSAWARVDAVPPAIRDVYAYPDLDWALVEWKTNESSDSTVLFGETPALGRAASVSDLTLNHSVLVSGLKPGTLYHYDVESADAAGNAVRADNQGSHFRFVTIYGTMGRPNSGYVGYVKENDPSGNYFTASEMIVGEGAQGTYLGAAQLDTGSSPIPPTATIKSATFELLGLGWIYQAPGQWRLRLLNSSADAGWSSKGYTAINAAATDDTMPPTLTENDVYPDIWNAFTFTPSQDGLLTNHVNSGRISFRLDGPTAGRNIFTWHTGNRLGTSTMGPDSPRLRVVYTTTGDMQGPIVTVLDASPNPTMSSSSTVTSITVSDLTTGGSNLSYAEYFWGTDPGIGKATPLMADDGGYDSPTESATLRIDVSTMPRGIYTIGVRGHDQADNWGPARTMTLYIGVWDLYPPAIDSLTFVPTRPESGSPVNISARITDDIAVFGAWADIKDFAGFPRGNFSMSYDSVLGRYFVNLAFDTLGGYRAVIWANDTSNKWNSTSGVFDVIDTTDPVILQMNATPTSQNYGNTVYFNAWVTDKFIDSVFITFQDPLGVPSGNFTTIRVGPPGDNYTYATTFQTLGQWTYCFAAVDTSGNWASACDHFDIFDGTPPVIVSVTATPPQQDYGNDVTIVANVFDRFISSVWVNVTGPGSVFIGNYSMTRVVPWEDNWTFSRPYSALGIHSFTVWASDNSGNTASAQGMFNIVDRVPPTFVSHGATPDPAQVGDMVKISTRVTDLQPVTVTVEIRNLVGSVLVNTSMTFNASSGNFEYTFQTRVIGRHTYVLWAVDASGNGATQPSDFMVLDTQRPSITLLFANRTLAETHNDVNVTVSIQDNYALETAALTIEWRDPSGSLITNTSLVSLGGNRYHFDIHLSISGTNRYTVTAEDTSGNTAVLRGQVDAVLGSPPTAVAGNDRNITTGTKLFFDASASTDDFGIVSYVWHITGQDTNVTLEGMNVSYTFNSSGTFDVTLTVRDAANHASSDSLTIQVSSVEQPAAGGIDAVIVILVALVVIITIVLVSMLLIAKRRKKENGPEEADEEEDGKEAGENEGD